MRACIGGVGVRELEPGWRGRRGRISAPPAGGAGPPARRRRGRRIPTGRAATRCCRGRPWSAGPGSRGPRGRTRARPRHRPAPPARRRYGRATPRGRAGGRHCRAHRWQGGPGSQGCRGTPSAAAGRSPCAARTSPMCSCDTERSRCHSALAGSSAVSRSATASPSRNDFSASAGGLAPPARCRCARRTPRGRAGRPHCRDRPPAGPRWRARWRRIAAPPPYRPVPPASRRFC